MAVDCQTRTFMLADCLLASRLESADEQRRSRFISTSWTSTDADETRNSRERTTNKKTTILSAIDISEAQSSTGRCFGHNDGPSHRRWNDLIRNATSSALVSSEIVIRSLSVPEPWHDHRAPRLLRCAIWKARVDGGQSLEVPKFSCGTRRFLI